MENFNQTSIFLTQSARDGVNCLFEDYEKFREVLKGNSQFVNVILNAPIDIETFIKWEAKFYNI